jgi:hypothetical protein
MKRRRWISIWIVCTGTILTAHSAAFAQEKRQQPKSEKKTPPKTQAAMSGCVDEQDGKYVLIHDQTRAVLANLEADGFPVEGFAKHVGHKVTVRGTANPDGGERPVFKVRAVETVADTCGAQHH